jgi:hypothetical protein
MQSNHPGAQQAIAKASACLHHDSMSPIASSSASGAPNPATTCTGPSTLALAPSPPAPGLTQPSPLNLVIGKMHMSLPPTLESEQIPAAMKSAHALFKSKPVSDMPLDKLDSNVCRPALFPLDTNFFASKAKWDHSMPTPHLSLISQLLAKAQAGARSSSSNSAAPAAPTTAPDAASDSPVSSAALFEQVKNAAHVCWT